MQLPACRPVCVSACLPAGIYVPVSEGNLALMSCKTQLSLCSWTLINRLLSSKLHTCKGKSQAVCLTPAGCHLTSLCLTGDEQKEVPLLGSTVQSVLAQAEAHGMQSIAMPLIGHGLAGWPAKLAARVHVEQVLRFCKAGQAGPSSLQVR